MFRQVWAAFCALILIAMPMPVHAARVAPMILDIEPIGRGTVARIEMASDSGRDIPYEVLMMRGDISEDGQLELTPADDDFLVFPTQVLLESNSRQVFRIQYVGEAELAESQIYYMSIKQIPVSFEEVQRSQVQVVVNYNVLVNVVPDGAEAEPVIRSITSATRIVDAPPPPPDEAATDASAETDEVLTDGLGNAPDEVASAEAVSAEAETIDDVAPVTDDVSFQPEPASDNPPPPATMEVSGLEVRVGNDGNRYFLAGLSIWKIEGTTINGERFEEEFAPSRIAQSIGAGVVGPGRDRIFFLPMETQLDPATVSIEIEIPDEEE
ncbi:MAG: hypothetical protein AAF697_12750 [Pseudomonadota bacterium]